jgi:hypothetical protein
MRPSPGRLGAFYAPARGKRVVLTAKAPALEAGRVYVLQTEAGPCYPATPREGSRVYRRVKLDVAGRQESRLPEVRLDDLLAPTTLAEFYWWLDYEDHEKMPGEVFDAVRGYPDDPNRRDALDAHEMREGRGTLARVPVEPPRAGEFHVRLALGGGIFGMPLREAVREGTVQEIAMRALPGPLPRDWSRPGPLAARIVYETAVTAMLNKLAG